MTIITLLGLIFGTFASEDLTCIATGLLIQRGQIGVSAGILACAAGIFAGDVGLWAIGRVFGRAALAWPWTARRLRTQKVEDAHDWLERHAAGAIVASRFLPGTRFALYVMSGALGGWLADRWRADRPGGRVLVQAAGLFCGAPFVILCGQTQSALWLVVALIAWGLFKGMYDANIYASIAAGF